MNVQIVFDAVVIAGLAWFWLRRAQPALRALRAEPAALRLGLAATVIAIAAMGVHLVAVATMTGEGAATWIRIAGGLVWILLVGIGHPDYKFLRHMTGTKRPGA